MSEMVSRFYDLNVKVGDLVEVCADCEANGLQITVPDANKANYSGYDSGNGVWVENRDGLINARHTGWCYGEENMWRMVSRAAVI